MVKLGDASVAAPFTSKISTIEAVCSIIRQGRCTLVTTIQMYKILALNSLISAYGLSVLHLAGIRYGDFQVTITGVLLSACFLFLTRSDPIKKLSPKRPQPNILNAYLLVSVLLQFAIHVGTLVVVMGDAARFSFPHKISHKAEFAPSLVNTAVYLLSLVMQLSTFVVNYQGRPFRESLFENKNLRNSLLAVSGVAMVAATEMIPEFNEWLQLVPMPPTFRRKLLSILFMDFFGCWAVETVAHRLLFTDTPKYS
jgi:cation-transporting ATPase 13A1